MLKDILQAASGHRNVTSTVQVEFIDHPLYSDPNMAGYWNLNNTWDSSPTGNPLIQYRFDFTTGYYNEGAYNSTAVNYTHYLKTTNAINIGSTWTICMWINPIVPFVASAPTYNHYSTFRGINDTNTLMINVNGVTDYTTVIKAFDWESNPGWHLVVYKYDGTNLKANVDGSSFDSIVTSNPLYNGSLVRYWFARYTLDNIHGWKGDVDELIIFTRELSDAEAISIYTG